MHIKFYSDQYFYSKYKKKILEISDEIFRSDIYTNGTYVKKLEKNLKKYFKVKYCIATSSGTSALHMSIKSLDLKKTDEIITSSNSFVATPMTVIYCNAKPKFIDTSLKNWNLDTDIIQKKITKNTKVIMPVHLHGLMTDMKKIRYISKKNNLKVIEDASQAFGAFNKYYTVAKMSDLATISFYPTKNLGTFGEGGAILTNNKDLFNKINRMRNWDKGKYELESYNYRMTELSAAVIIEKLKFSKELLKLRDEIRDYYLSKLDLNNFQIQNFSNDFKHSNHIFGILIGNRDKLLKNKNVEFSTHYNYSLPYLKIFRNSKTNYFNNSLYLSKKLLSLPIYPGLTKKKLDTIIDIVNKHNKVHRIFKL